MVQGRLFLRRGAIAATVLVIVTAATLASALFIYPGILRTSNNLSIVIQLDSPTFWKKYSFAAVQVVATNGPYVASSAHMVKPGAKSLTLHINKASLLRPQPLALARSSVKHLAAVEAILYLYDKSGRLCIKIAKVTTFEYFLAKTRNTLEAGKQAYEHPDALLRLNRLEFRLPMFSKCIYIDKALAKIVQEIKKTHQIRIEDNPGYYLIPSDVKFELIYSNLYEQRYNPPQQWTQRIVPSGAAPDAWYMFATRYSYGLLFPADKYSVGEALSIALDNWYHQYSRTATKTGSQEVAIGLDTMTQLVRSLLSSAGVYWENQLAPGSILKHFDAAPIAILHTYCDNCQDVILTADMTFATGQVEYTNAGISILGVITYPEPTLVTGIEASPCGGILIDGNMREKVLYAPMNDVYVADGITLLYYVDETVIDGKQYWEIIPVYYNTIIHYYDYDYSSMKCASFILGETNDLFWKLQQAENYLLNDMNLKYVTIYDNTLYADFSTDILLDKCSSTSISEPSVFAGLFASAINYAVSSLLGYVPGGSDLSSMIGVSIMDLGVKMNVFKVAISSANKHYWIHVTASKYVPVNIVDALANSNNCRPTALIYNINVHKIS